jgi:hypothetical protein
LHVCQRSNSSSLVRQNKEAVQTEAKKWYEQKSTAIKQLSSKLETTNKVTTDCLKKTTDSFY